MGLPDLRDIPSCIGGDPSKRTGIVVAKSIPAKKYGIQTGEPMAMAFRKCPNLVAVPSDFELYDKCSRAFKKICGSYAPVMESFSIDEVFLDMTGTSYIYPDPVATAHELKDKIRTELGFTVNIGISTNKLLAKMASDFEKPDKVHTLDVYKRQAYIIDYLKTDTGFSKLLYKYMLQEDTISGEDLCLVLYEQGVLSKEDELYQTCLLYTSEKSFPVLTDRMHCWKE